jgi:hypothetical protein
MSVSQLEALKTKFGEVEITQLSASPANVHVAFECATPETGETVADNILQGNWSSLKELVTKYDEIAVVLPIGMLQQLLPFSPAKRLLQSKNKRVLLDEGKVQFVFDGWEAVTKIEIITTPL